MSLTKHPARMQNVGFTASTAVDRVPSEVWASIFIDCLPDVRFVAPNSMAAPLVLCTVCRKWRYVARSTSKLWSSIHVEVTMGNDTREIVKGVACWLSRSGTRPLAISCTWIGIHPRISYMASQQVPECMRLTPLLELFSLAIQRWESIKLKFSGNLEAVTLPHIEGKQAPLLRRFEFHIRPAYYVPALSPILAMLKASSQLREVSWCYSNRLGLQPLEIGTFPWPQLTWFETQNTMTSAEFVHILQHCPDITHGMFTIKDQFPDPSASLTIPVVHEKLLRLDLLIHAETMSFLLEYLTLPALCSLAVRGSGDFDVWPHDNFMAFLSRLRSPLERLKLSSTSIDSTELIEILLLAPTLRNLCIEGFTCTFLRNNFFRALTLHEDDQEGHTHLCPRLETLTLRATSTSSEGVLADMVESRYNLEVEGFTKLRRVDITVTWDLVGTCDYERLDALSQKGLVFFVPANGGETAWDEDRGGQAL